MTEYQFIISLISALGIGPLIGAAVGAYLSRRSTAALEHKRRKELLVTAYVEWAACIEETLSAMISFGSTYGTSQAVLNEVESGATFGTLAQENEKRMFIAGQISAKGDEAEKARRRLEAHRFRLLLLEDDPKRKVIIDRITDGAMIGEHRSIQSLAEARMVAEPLRTDLRKFLNTLSPSNKDLD